ncbi:PTS sugar transporter subunit IIA [Streptococcus uberis]|nr:PTS sugar transporter subunit IIA [Streptococcus uberis]
MTSNNIEMNMSKIINPELISLSLKSKTKSDAIEELSELLYKNGDIRNIEEYIYDVHLREKEGITGIGQGLAIPHGKSTSVINTKIAIGLADHNIEWESLDGNPVNTIILFAVRDQDSSTLHLKLLQKVAVLISDDEFVRKLHNVKSKEELIKMFK